jgi:putative FmdB family regulatory protein
MPIYAYKCGSCGHAKDVLQKLSDAPLATCPACGAATFTKQVTAAGFQLKGSGWYVTDFRNNGNSAAPAAGGAKPTEPASAETPSSDAKSADAKSADAKSADAKSGDTPPASTAGPAKSDAPAASSAGSA